MTQPAGAPPFPQGPTFPAKAAKPGGKVGIWIGVVLILIGIVGGIALIVGGVSSLADGLTEVDRVSIDTGGTVLLDETGTYSVYAERRVPGGGTSFNTSTTSGFVPDVQVSIIDPDGNEALVRPALGSESYTVDGHEGTRIGKFDAPKTGIYTVRVVGGQSVASYDSIAVGKGLHLDGIGMILGGVFGGGLLVLIGVILIIVFAVKRSRRKRKAAQAANPYGSAVPGAPGAGWPQPPAYGAPGAYPAAGGYGAPGAPWQPPGQSAPPAAGQAPGWAPPPTSPGAVGSPTPPPAAPVPTWQPPADAPAPDAPPPSSPPADAPTWQAPPPPAPPASPPGSWPPASPPTGPDEPTP